MDALKVKDDKPTESKETFDEVPLDLSVKADDNKTSLCVPMPESKQDLDDEKSTPKKSVPLDLTFTSSMLRSPPSSPLILTAPMFPPAKISRLSPPIIIVNQSPIIQRPSTVIRSPIAAAPAPAFYMPFNPSARIANQYVTSSIPRNFTATSLPTQFSPVSSPNQFFPASIPSQFSTASLPSQFSTARQPVHDATPQLNCNFAPILSGNMLNYAQPFMFKTSHDPWCSKADNTLPQPALPSATQIHHQQHQLRQHQQEHIELQQQQMHQQQQLQQVQEFQAQLHKSVQQHLATYGTGGFRWFQQYINSPVSPLPDFENRPFSIPERFVRSMDNYRPSNFDGLFGGGDIRINVEPDSSRSDDESTDDQPESSQQDDLPDDVDPEEIAEIYRQTEFVQFRQRYLDSLGPPRNFEKMRRSVPNRIINGHQMDKSYVLKRLKNNEAAKKSRDAKRQKYIENKISVMYLTKKVNELREIKRQLLMTNRI